MTRTGRTSWPTCVRGSGQLQEVFVKVIEDNCGVIADSEMEPSVKDSESTVSPCLDSGPSNPSVATTDHAFTLPISSVGLGNTTQSSEPNLLKLILPAEPEASSLASSVLVTGSSDVSRMQQNCWSELREDFRTVYTLVMDGAWLDTNRPHPSLPIMHAAVLKLVFSDPHQLFQKLEAELREVVIELKSNLAGLLSQQESPELAEVFLHSLLVGHERLCEASRIIGPVMGSLQVNHLTSFSLTWDLMSKHLYQLLVLEDHVIQDNLKVYISQLKTCHNPNSSQLVIRFLDLVKEMENVSASWAVAEAHLMEYSHEQEKMEEDDAGGSIDSNAEHIVNKGTSVIVQNVDYLHPEPETSTQSNQYTHSFDELETGLKFESYQAASIYIKNWCNTNQLPLVIRDSFKGSETKAGRILYECPHGTKRKYKDTLVRERQGVNFTACGSQVNIYQSLRDKCFKVTKCVKVHSGHLIGDGVYGSYPIVRSMNESTLNKVMQLEGVGASRRRVADVIGEETGMSITVFIGHIYNDYLFHRDVVLSQRHLQPGYESEEEGL